MKGFFITLIIVCALVGAGWYTYDPYIRPFLEENNLLEKQEPADLVEGSDEETGDSTPDTTGAEPASKPEPEEDSAGTASAATEPDKPDSKANNGRGLEAMLAEKYPLPEIQPLEEIVDGWRNVPPKAYPSEVTASETIPFKLVVDGQAIGSSNVAPGTPLKVVGLQNGRLTVGNPANPGMSATISVDRTDFKQRIRKRYEDFVERVTERTMARRDRARASIEKDPSKLAMITGEEPPEPASPTDEASIDLVKESLRKGEASTVKLEEARSFRWNGKETVAGAFPGTYDTVTVEFEVGTIFGKFPIEYKALIKGNSVVGWIDPISEERI